MCFASAAASVADRSPFAQGHWWDPSRAGHGFDLLSIDGQVVLTWYTYAEDGRPVWYTAQGPYSDVGARPFPLLRHRWEGGRRAEATVAGSVKLTLAHAESAVAEWTIGTHSGSWSIRPFVASGIVNEVDHTGSWFDPNNDGWGLSVTEQGDIAGGVLFTYDAAGTPTWVAGFGADRASVELHAFTGACPYCSARTPTSHSVGSLAFDFAHENDLRLASSLSLPMAPGVAVGGARLVQIGRPASRRPADRQLASFASNAALRAYLDVGMHNVLPSQGSLDASGPPAQAYSAELAEAGVDEAALVKTDGRFVYTFGYTGLVRRGIIRVAETGIDGATMQPRGSVSLQSGINTPVANAGLFIHAGNLVSVVGTMPAGAFTPWISSGAWTRGKTYVEVFSLASPEAPVTTWRAEIDGHLLSSRRVGNRVYLVTRFVPYVPGFVYGTAFPPAVAANQALLASTPLEVLLPNVTVNGSPVDAVGAATIFVPPQGMRQPLADMVMVTALDLTQPRVAQSLAIVGPVETVYTSATSLYLATSRSQLRTPYGALLPVEPASYVTDVHQLRLGASAMEIVGSGSIEGFLGTDADQAAFRLNEHQGRLRAVTSSSAWWGPVNRNRLTVLEPSETAPGLLRTVSYLPNAQRPATLGKPGEFLRAARFAEDRLYAVTSGPLHVVDLANAQDPRIAGELQATGFSEYLHALPGGQLLGFGRDATAAGITQGLRLALYDVSDAARPRELQKITLGRRGSESALLHHHQAFSARTRADGSTSIAIPVRIHDGTAQLGDATVYPWLESGLARFEVKDAALVALPMLVTHRSSSSFLSYFEDPAAEGGRPVLLPNGAVYVGNGLFWHQENFGDTRGPF
ncbi:MAG TPA: beta-propeller domain-containing protein [Usitatibacter sp.]|nr:beta-propeller domain-containing protein [Usitatibacter sp.]